MEPPILVKLGGSLITDKTKEETPNKKNIRRLAKEICKARAKAGFSLIVGHGGGSFPHVAAHKFQTQKGVSGPESYRGIAEVQDAAARLNRLIISALLKEGETAVSIQPSASMVAEGGRISDGYLKPIEKALEFGMLPVPYGDVMFDSKQGCCIISTEEILNFLAKRFGSKRIIIVADVDGVFSDYPTSSKLVEEITHANFPEVKNILLGSNATDVTGGMLHKVERMMELANESGAEILILNGSVKNRLRDALLGKKVTGTVVRR